MCRAHLPRWTSRLVVRIFVFHSCIYIADCKSLFYAAKNGTSQNDRQCMLRSPISVWKTVKRVRAILVVRMRLIHGMNWIGIRDLSIRCRCSARGETRRRGDAKIRNVCSGALQKAKQEGMSVSERISDLNLLYTPCSRICGLFWVQNGS